ncbi:MAG: hypothetical protein JO356_08360 [Acidobacteria bacterium]|nr:hypothetical protein [Acidobacteriota bacterium]
MKMAFAVAVITLALSLTAVGQDHSNLQGTWYLDKAHSHYPAESATEVITQHDDVVDITFTEQGPGHSNPPMQLHLATDGKPTTNTVGSNKFTATTHWDGNKLVTYVEGDRGQHMTETREVSSDGSTLTVTGYHQDELKKPYYVRVMTKNKS